MIEPKIERSISGGIQKIFAFPNGYGASVVRHQFSYGGSNGFWELAVIQVYDIENPLQFELMYDTPITGDVIGYLNDEQVEKILEQIKQLEGMK